MTPCTSAARTNVVRLIRRIVRPEPARKSPSQVLAIFLDLLAIMDKKAPTLGERESRATLFLRLFMNYGLVAAVLVWAGAVGLMAYHLEDSPWRWAFAALSAGGLLTVVVILRIRRYVNALSKQPQQEPKP
jgi:hypothetical protein